MNNESPTASSTGAKANSRSEVDLDNLWHRDAQAFLSFLPNTPLRDCLTRRLEEVYSARHDLQNQLLNAQQRSRIKTQIQECGNILEGLLDNRLEQDFRKEILKRYGNKRINRVKDISMSSKANFATKKGIITKELAKQICNTYHLRNNCHIDRELRKNYVPSTSDAQKAFETLEKFVSQLKVYLNKAQH